MFDAFVPSVHTQFVGVLDSDGVEAPTPNSLGLRLGQMLPIASADAADSAPLKTPFTEV